MGNGRTEPDRAQFDLARAPLSVREIGQIVENFAAAARRAVEAGFDFIEIHGAHGYLIHSFLSPLANLRDGGTPDRRMRFALEVAAAVRAAIPPAMPLSWRVSAVDHDPQGLGIRDTVRLAMALKKAGIDVDDASSGGINGPIARANIPQHPGHQVGFAAEIRREAEIATMAVGLIVDGEQAEEIVASGSADLVALGRELLADPAFAYRAARALKLPSPEEVLPLQFSFYLTHREQVLSAFRRQ